MSPAGPGPARGVPALRLRPARPEDGPILLRLYASTREAELRPVPWTEAEKAAFVDQQFRAQAAHYRAKYPGARFDVVEADGEPVGRLYANRGTEELRLMDITLLPAHRGRGIGARLIRDLIREADEAGLPVTLYVESWNPARRLYDRLGFEVAETGPVYDLLRRPPSARAADG